MSAATRDADHTPGTVHPAALAAMSEADAQNTIARLQLARACREAYDAGRSLVLAALCLGALSGAVVGFIAGAVLF